MRHVSLAEIACLLASLEAHSEYKKNHDAPVEAIAITIEAASKIGDGTFNGYEGESSCFFLVSTGVLVTASLIVGVSCSVSLISSSGDDDRNNGVVGIVVYDREACRVVTGI